MTFYIEMQNIYGAIQWINLSVCLETGINSWTGTEGWPVSSLICDRWQQLNLEPFNRCRRCWLTLMFQVTRAVSWPSRLEGRGRELNGWPATDSPDGRTDGRAGGSPTYRAAARLGTKKRSQYKAGRPTRYSTRLLNNTTHTHTHTLRVAQWA